MLGKCLDCQNGIKAGEEYWVLSKNNKAIGEYCLTCWNQRDPSAYTFQKKRK